MAVERQMISPVGLVHDFTRALVGEPWKRDSPSD